VLSNANRFTPAGGAVAVSVRRDGERVRIDVEDSGPGIATEDRAEIFLPFFRVQRDGAAQVPGSGLGLAVAKRLIELQGGTIWVEAASGGSDATGSRFCVELGVLGPVASAGAAAPPASEGPARTEPSEQSAESVQSTPSRPSGR
jgi:signal transduction histidine kinase